MFINFAAHVYTLYYIIRPILLYAKYVSLFSFYIACHSDLVVVIHALFLLYLICSLWKFVIKV
jgi:hypothetical protein